MATQPPDDMALEMAAQPDAIRRLLGALAPDPEGPITFEASLQTALKAQPHMLWAACGSSFWAATLGAYALAALALRPCFVRPAHELVALGPAAFRGVELSILVSQSGETQDTLEALRLAQAHRAPTLAIVNAPASQMGTTSRWCIDIQAGPELAVPSTKGFMAQAATSLLIAGAYAARQAPEAVRDMLRALHALPCALAQLDVPSGALEALVRAMQDAPQAIFLGRGPDYPIAAEGALKLMESAQIPAHGYAMGEFKHGPMACLSPQTPVVAIVSGGALAARTRQNLNQIRACGAPVWWIGPTHLHEMQDFDGHHIVVPESHALVSPLIAVRVLQSLAWLTAHAKGRNPNAPRHLVKSVQRV